MTAVLINYIIMSDLCQFFIAPVSGRRFREGLLELFHEVTIGAVPALCCNFRNGELCLTQQTASLLHAETYQLLDDAASEVCPVVFLESTPAYAE